MLSTTPVSRDVPYLYVDGTGKYRVFLPSLRTNASAASWANICCVSGWRRGTASTEFRTTVTVLSWADNSLSKLSIMAIELCKFLFNFDTDPHGIVHIGSLLELATTEEDWLTVDWLWIVLWS